MDIENTNGSKMVHKPKRFSWKSTAKLGATLLVAAYLANKIPSKYMVNPVAVADMNGDGKEEAIVLRADMMYNNLWRVVVIDGKYITEDAQKNKWTAAFGHVVRGAFFEPRSSFPRAYAVGEFDVKPGIDLKISEVTPDFPVTIDKVISNISETYNR